jgi:methylase of polypeptide subunit release factors
VGTLLAAVGAAQVMLTDGNTQALDNCIRNLALNGCEPYVVDSYQEAHSREVQVGCRLVYAVPYLCLPACL